MNKQEAIEKIDRTLSLPRSIGGYPYDYEDGLRYAKRIINQIEEPEKTIVPWFVADWYEKYKDEFEYYLKGFIAKVGYEINHNTKDEFYQWLGNPHNDPILKLVNMHQFGYEVEKEKLYTARLKVVTIKKAGYLNRHNKNGSITIDTSYTAGGQYQVYFTRSELEELGVWDNPAFEIEEVE